MYQTLSKMIHTKTHYGQKIVNKRKEKNLQAVGEKAHYILHTHTQ